MYPLQVFLARRIEKPPGLTVIRIWKKKGG
jgi:hypothetical protein